MIASEEEIRNKISKLQSDIHALNIYARMKVRHRDRHGTIDAEMDARELEAMVEALRWVLSEGHDLP